MTNSYPILRARLQYLQEHRLTVQEATEREELKAVLAHHVHDERAYLLARIKTVEGMLEQLSDNNPLSRLNLEDHLEDMRGELAAMDAA